MDHSSSSCEEYVEPYLKFRKLIRKVMINLAQEKLYFYFDIPVAEYLVALPGITLTAPTDNIS
jgi:hypothetical protein